MSDMGKRQTQRESHRSLTLRQKLVLEWLIQECGEEEKTITTKRIGKALLISEKAARVQVDALVKKNLILSAVACNQGSGRPIGRLIRITQNAVLALNQSNETEAQKDDWARELSIYQLSETEFQSIRAIAIEDIKNETGKIYKEPSELMVSVYLKNSLSVYVAQLKNEKNNREYMARYHQTLTPLEQRASINPDDPVAWYTLADAYEQYDRLDKATEAYEKALEINPNCTNALYSLGKLYKKDGQTDKVTEMFNRLEILNQAMG